jgi:hypothetical protein
VRDLLADAIRFKIDSTFISAAAAVAGVSPAGITNGITPIASSGTTAAAIATDLQKVAAAFIAANIDPRQVTAVMNPVQLLYLMGLRGVNDAAYFPTLTAEGGTIYGMRVVTTTQIPITGVAPTRVASILFIHQPSVLLASDPAIRVDVSREAAVEMSNDPEVDSGALISLWQNNMVGLLLEQFITWARAREAGVQVLTGVPIGGA